MRHIPGIAIAALAFAWGPAQGAGMSKQDYQAAKKRIAAEYQAERQKCGARHGNALDLCVAHAHGARDVAKAELEAEYKPSPRTNYDAAIARSKAAHATAKEECDEKRGAEETACMKDAKASLARARAEAESARTANRAEEAAAAPRK
jgi:hypothetical protein